MKWLHIIAFVLLFIGGLNWGLVGLFDFNLVMALFGVGMFAKLIYILVGLSTVYIIVTHKMDCKICSMKMKGKR